MNPDGVGRVWTVQVVPFVDTAADSPLTTTQVFTAHEIDG